MANVIKIKKGLDINLKGKALEVLMTSKNSNTYAIVPSCYVGIVPKVIAKVGDKVKAGTPLMIDKKRPEIKFVSPISGELIAVNRGEKRKILSVVVAPDALNEYEDFGKKKVASLSGEEVKNTILNAGMWPFIIQRPYDRIASPEETPRDIFVSANFTAPLAPNFNFVVQGEEANLQAGLTALSKMTAGKVYVSVGANSENIQKTDAKNIEYVQIEGPHPAGNVGVLINQVAPINKGDLVWTLNATDVIIIGRLFNEGKADFTRMVAITGSETTERGYVKAIAGCTIESLIGGRMADGSTRIISGNALTGTKVSTSDYLGAYDSQITVIPEGDDYHELFGWAVPGLDKFSVSHSYPSWMLGKKKEYTIDARIRGGRRAMIMSNEYDSVFPMDIFPEYLIKAILAFDIDKMESLGIYEVAPEDFALCEFVDTSKLELQHIVRQGLDLLYKEMN